MYNRNEVDVFPTSELNSLKKLKIFLENIKIKVLYLDQSIIFFGIKNIYCYRGF